MRRQGPLAEAARIRFSDALVPAELRPLQEWVRIRGVGVCTAARGVNDIALAQRDPTYQLDAIWFARIGTATPRCTTSAAVAGLGGTVVGRVISVPEPSAMQPNRGHGTNAR
jgi:hypothetical protein